MAGPVGLAVAAGVLMVATGFGLWWRRRDGKVRPEPLATGDRAASEQPAAAAPGAGPLLAELGVPAGTPVTLLQFSSAFCAPCRATRVVCGQVAADHQGVRHVEVDAESHLDAVRALRVWRTPTVFVVDVRGRPVARIVGQPTRAQATEAVAPLLAGADR